VFPQSFQWFKGFSMTKQFVDDRYPLSELSAKAIGAMKVVHRELGPGFQEVIYQRALALEFPIHGVNFSREVWVDVRYRDQIVGKKTGGLYCQ
jgi:hypothetical protein